MQLTLPQFVRHFIHCQYTDIFGNLVFTIDLWNINFARFISQKSKEIFNWGQSTIKIFMQSS